MSRSYVRRSQVERMEGEQLKRALQEKALALGFNMVGVVSAQPGRRLDAYLSWIAQAYHGQMGYLARPDRLARRRDLNVILSGVRSIICVGLDYATPEPPQHIVRDPARGRISNYAWNIDYHETMLPRLQELAHWLQTESNEHVASKGYVDTGAIMERDHAETAGMGFTGKNTMLIHPRRGSYFFLGELLTTCRLPSDEARFMPSCGRCRRCLDACPTNAFPQPYLLDARRCISYLTIELKEWIPRDLRPLMGNWVYGCDVCQEVCPFNRFSPISRETAFQRENWDDTAPPLLTLLAMDEQTFAERFSNSPIKRIRRRRLVRNACVAAGNWGNPAATPLLGRLLTDQEPLVRGHAAWALGRMRDAEAPQLLAAAQVFEQDPQVLEEVALALNVAQSG